MAPLSIAHPGPAAAARTRMPPMPTPSAGMSPWRLPPQWFLRLVPIQPQVWLLAVAAPTALTLFPVLAVGLTAAPGAQLTAPMVHLVSRPSFWLQLRPPRCKATVVVPLTLMGPTLPPIVALPVQSHLWCLLRRPTVAAVVMVVAVAAVVAPLMGPVPQPPAAPVIPAVPARLPLRSSSPPWILVPWGTS